MTDEETKDERLNRELEELLQELRLALPGVQILFAFLLVVPFNNRFEDIDNLQRDVWFAALLLALAAVACFIAPTAYHRIRFRDHDKEQLVKTGTRLALAGLVFLASALSASAFFVTGLVFGDGIAAVVTAIAVGMLGGLWFVPAARTRTARLTMDRITDPGRVRRAGPVSGTAQGWAGREDRVDRQSPMRRRSWPLRSR